MSTATAGQATQPAESGQGQPQPTGAQGTPIFGKYADIAAAEKGYKELESKLGELGTRAKIADQLDQYGGLDSVLQWAKWGATEYSNRQKQPQPAQPSTPAGDPYEGWDVLTPQQQAQRQTTMVQKAVMDAVNGIAAQFRTEFQTGMQGLNQQWDIYRKVLKAVQKNPGLDADALMQQMVAIATGNTDNLLELAAKGLTSGSDAEAAAKALFETWKLEEETKRRNQQIDTLTGTSTSNGFGQPQTIPKTKGEENALIVKRLLESGLPPGAF